MTSNFIVASTKFQISPQALGSVEFRRTYGVRYAYLAGAMYKGIASKELVVAMGRAGLMSFLGTGGMDLKEIEAAIHHIQASLSTGQAYGMNLLAAPGHPELESQIVELYIQHRVRVIEAAAFTQMTPALVRYRLSGLKQRPNGGVDIFNRIIGKVSRPEVAAAFMHPAPPTIVNRLLSKGLISTEEAELSRQIPMADDICVEADSGGHTDQGVAQVLIPVMRLLRDEIQREQKYVEPIRVGAAGGIGTPEAAAAAFILGADFVVTGSINQCTVESGTSDTVKDMLQDINVQDTDYAPAGDMFEFGAKVQVLSKGRLFAVRANKLYELYKRHNSIEEIDEKTRREIQDKYFKRSFEEVWSETRAYLARRDSSNLSAILNVSAKQKMALIFRWYFVHTTRLALRGSEEQKVDYQVHCGPALGAFNQWVKGTSLEHWRKRHVAELGDRIMQGAAQVLTERLLAFNHSISSQLPVTHIPVKI